MTNEDLNLKAVLNEVPLNAKASNNLTDYVNANKSTLLELKNRGQSYKQIADIIKAKTKKKISEHTLRKLLATKRVIDYSDSLTKVTINELWLELCKRENAVKNILTNTNFSEVPKLTEQDFIDMYKNLCKYFAKTGVPESKLVNSMREVIKPKQE